MSSEISGRIFFVRVTYYIMKSLQKKIMETILHQIHKILETVKTSVLFFPQMNLCFQFIDLWKNRISHFHTEETRYRFRILHHVSCLWKFKLQKGQTFKGGGVFSSTQPDHVTNVTDCQKHIAHISYKRFCLRIFFFLKKIKKKKKKKKKKNRMKV